MSEPGRHAGSALRIYQITAILALGWLAGRLPDLWSANEVKQQQLRATLSPLGADPAYAAVPTDATLAADMAARVAAQVAEQTISRLIAAGWGPALPGGSFEQRAGVARETVVRAVTEVAPSPAQPAFQGWSIAPAAAPATSDYILSPVPAEPAAMAQAPTPVPTINPGAQHAHQLATDGYAALQAGDRRKAASLLQQAVETAPNAQGAPQWRADAAQLTRRWSIAGYMLSRSGSGANDPLAASPVLGGGQAGVAAGYTLNPLADARVSVIGRATAASKSNGALDNETAEAALGLRLQPFRGVPFAIDAERRFALGWVARNGWAARISGGTTEDVRLGGRVVRVEAYGEAGAIGFKDTAIYAGGQMRGGTPVLTLGKIAMDGGAGVWGATQKDYGRTVSRLDVGPSAQFRIEPWPFRAQVDYRFRTAGKALPDSGPVITVSGEF